MPLPGERFALDQLALPIVGAPLGGGDLAAILRYAL